MIRTKIANLEYGELGALFKCDINDVNSVKESFLNNPTIKYWQFLDSNVGYFISNRNRNININQSIQIIVSFSKDGYSQFYQHSISNASIFCLGRIKDNLVVGYNSCDDSIAKISFDLLNEMKSLEEEDDTLNLIALTVEAEMQGVSATINNLYKYKVKKLILIGKKLIVSDSNVDIKKIVDINDSSLQEHNGILLLRTLVLKRNYMPQDTYNWGLTFRTLIPRKLIDNIDYENFTLKYPYNKSRYSISNRRILLVGDDISLNTKLLSLSLANDDKIYEFSRLQTDYGTKLNSDEDSLKEAIRKFDERARLMTVSEKKFKLRQTKNSLRDCKTNLKSLQKDIEKMDYVLKRNLPIPEVINYESILPNNFDCNNGTSVYFFNDCGLVSLEFLMHESNGKMVLDFKREGDGF